MTKAGQRAWDIPEGIRQRFQNAKRTEVRRQAADAAAAFIRTQTAWSREDLHTLLVHLQTDWYNSKLLRNRFSPGLFGQNEMWLAESMDALGAWLGAVREAASTGLDDERVRRLLDDYWKADIKAPLLFPTAVLSAFAPDKYVAWTKPITAALNALDPDGSYKRTMDASEYLRLCRTLRTMCKREGWPLCLADAALHVSSEPEPAPVPPSHEHEFSGYSSESVAFVRSLAEHTKDPVWHQQNKERYETLLRDPTKALIRDIAARYIAPRDPDVANVERRTSFLKKNDRGGNGYYSHYWFAFYDPAASKTESVQLYASLMGDRDCLRYGLNVGHYGQRYHENLLRALRTSPASIADYLKTLPGELRVRRQYQDGSETIASIAELATALRSGSLDAFLQDEARLRGVAIERVVEPLTRLVKRGSGLADDIGQVFDALWPFFEAARTGEFPGESPGSDPIKKPSEDPIGPQGPEIDDAAPESLVDLQQATSLSEDFLRDMEEALLAKGQVILLGPPGTSKTYIAQQFARYFVRYQPERPAQGEHRTIYMHASWAYEDFFEGIRPRVDVNGLEFSHHRGAFLSWVEDTVKKGPPTARYVLVLDEINRCDTAAVLGELLQLMEYRGRQVQLLSGRTFSLPRKLYIIGTMNSADRSIGRLDLALRRRFLFLDLFPDPDVLQAWLDADAARNPSGFQASALRQCNAWLEKQHGIAKEQQVGHALFMPSAVHGDGEDEDGVLTSAMVRRIVRYSVLPYVRELLLERGRDPGPALSTVEGFFSMYWPADEGADA